MNLRALLVVLVIICALQLADVSAAKKKTKKTVTHHHQCKHRKLGVFKVGEHKPYPNKKCAEIVCKSNGKLTSLQCSRHLKPKKRCSIAPGDKKKAFPNCCPQIACPVSNRG